MVGCHGPWHVCYCSSPLRLGPPVTVTVTASATVTATVTASAGGPGVPASHSLNYLSVFCPGPRVLSQFSSFSLRSTHSQRPQCPPSLLQPRFHLPAFGPHGIHRPDTCYSTHCLPVTVQPSVRASATGPGSASASATFLSLPARGPHLLIPLFHLSEQPSSRSSLPQQLSKFCFGFRVWLASAHT